MCLALNSLLLLLLSLFTVRRLYLCLNSRFLGLDSGQVKQCKPLFEEKHTLDKPASVHRQRRMAVVSLLAAVQLFHVILSLETNTHRTDPPFPQLSLILIEYSNFSTAAFAVTHLTLSARVLSLVKVNEILTSFLAISFLVSILFVS